MFWWECPPFLRLSTTPLTARIHRILFTCQGTLEQLLPCDGCKAAVSEHGHPNVSSSLGLKGAYPEVALLDHMVSVVFWRTTYHTIFCSSCTILYAHQQCTRVPISLFKEYSSVAWSTLSTPQIPDRSSPLCLPSKRCLYIPAPF